MGQEIAIGCKSFLHAMGSGLLDNLPVERVSDLNPISVEVETDILSQTHLDLLLGLLVLVVKDDSLAIAYDITDDRLLKGLIGRRCLKDGRSLGGLRRLWRDLLL